MSRRLAVTLATAAICAAVAGPAASAASAAGYPPPCPVRPLVDLRDSSTAYVSVGCTTVAVPLPVSVH